MNLTKFKKKTNSNKNISNITRIDISNLFKTLKVVQIINYYTIEVVIYNYTNFYKIIFELNDVDFFDDKLNIVTRDSLHTMLKQLILGKYFTFNIDNIIYSKTQPFFSLKFIGSITFCEEESLASINTIMKNKIINILVLKDKIKAINQGNGNRLNIIDKPKPKVIMEIISEE